MVKSFSIAKKPRVLFGVGLTTEAPKELKKAGCKNIFVLSDPVLKKMGAFQPLYDALDSEGLDYVICDEFDRDPTDVMVNHVASIAVEAKIDGIIGIGGGATMDIAKCVNQLIHSEFPINRYLAPDFATPTLGVPLVLIPTTPGTGSETSSALSLIDTINNVKTGNVTENNIATLAIVDPTYCMTMPDSLTAQSGLDTMCHAVESIVSAQRNHMSTALSLKSFELVWNNLPKALSDENCLEVRAEMSAAGLMAGIAYTDAQVNFGHFIIHALGARYHTPHGELCGVVLPYLAEFCTKYMSAEMAQIARIIGIDPAAENFGAEMAEKIRVFVRGTGLRSLAGCGIPKEEVLEMTEMMYGGFQSSRATASCMKQAPKAEFTHFIEKIASDQ